MKNTNTNANANATHAKVEAKTFLVWVREKTTRECKVIQVKANKLSEIAGIIRSEGKYSFKAAGATKEELEKAMAKWEETNAKSIAYHKQHDNKEAFENAQNAMAILKKKLTKAEFEEVCNALKLNKYVGS